jgi:ketosteroid isomerase-like protein
MDNAEEKKRLITQYFETNTDFDIPRLLEVLSDDIVAYYTSRTVHGKDEFRKHVEGTFSVSEVDPLSTVSAKLTLSTERKDFSVL